MQMFSMVRRHVSFASLIAILALIFAMAGGAWAAKKVLITSTSQISKSVLKQLKGKRGPQGQAGPQGPKGDPGAAGQNGAPGAEGSPWTAGGTLPSGKTETGAWAVGGGAEELAPISFNIPLASAPTIEFHKEGYTGTAGANCPGSSLNPTAKPGFVCVYTDAEVATEYKVEVGFPHVYKSGAVMYFKDAAAPVGFALGTWAVTG